MNTRNCPNCNIEIIYSSKYAYEVGVNKNTLCKICSRRKTSRDNVELGRLKGPNNPSFGKKFSQKRKDNISKNHADVSGDKNPMFGKSFYECWVEKYGKDVADKKQLEYCHKLSKARMGDKNNMFGKPSPQGSGNGWSGWYKGWYFRSLLELSYMIKVIERFNLKWKSAECKELAIPYTNWEGKQRTYFADFLINDKYLVECKPKKLHNTPTVLSKSFGAKTFSKKRGLTYKLRCVRILNEDAIRKLVTNGEIEFLPKYQDKYNKIYDDGC